MTRQKIFLAIGALIGAFVGSSIGIVGFGGGIDRPCLSGPV